jgi:hypothetical protein
MKRILIKTYLILTIVYLSSLMLRIYSRSTGMTIRLTIWLIVLTEFIPGLIAGIIFNYEGVLKFAQSKLRKIDPRFIYLSIVLVVLASYPTWSTFMTVTRIGLLDEIIISSFVFQFALGLLAGYSITQSLTTQD